MGRLIPKPTDAELAILRVLWTLGPSTVRQVLVAMHPGREGVGYTTILKLLQIMAAKGLVLRDEAERTHTYRPAISEEQTQRRMVRDLLAKAFGGSAPKLLTHALDAVKASPKDLAEIRKLLDQRKEQK